MAILLLVPLGCHLHPARSASKACASARDFAGAIVTHKMGPAPKTGRVLALLWDPHRASDPAPEREDVERRLFGPNESVADWFRENSGGKFAIEKAGCLGWYAAKKSADHYWATSASTDSKDSDGDGWLNGHVEKWAEAIRDADPEFDYAAYDSNRDGTLDPSELAVLVVIPQNGPFGTVRGVVGREYPQVEPLVVDGVRIDEVSEWYTGAPLNWPAAAHELCHLLLGAPDLYSPPNWPYSAGSYSIMDRCYVPVHLDPFEKMKLGWLDVRVVTESGYHTLRPVETQHEALLLYSPEHGTGEYFIIEYRRPAGTYDEGNRTLGPGVPQTGLAVWHIVEDPSLLRKAKLPEGVSPDEWGRAGIRLARWNQRGSRGLPIDDSRALYATLASRIEDDSSMGHFNWADGSDSGISFILLETPGPLAWLHVQIVEPVHWVE